MCGLAEGTVTRPLAEPHADDVVKHHDHLGWHAQGDGKFFLGLPIENGRIKDEGSLRIKTALRKVFGGLAPNARLTAHQNLLLCDVEESNRPAIEKILSEHGVVTIEQISNARRFAFACPALPTCGLAVTESERVLPEVISELETELAAMGLAEQQFTVRMTGCPNGCARPYNADIGLVGKSIDGKSGEGKYTIFVGGNMIGTRMNVILKDLVLRSQIVPTLKPLLKCFKDNAQPGETLGDFFHRWGVEALQQLTPSS